MTHLLLVKEITKNYGGVQALNHLSLGVCQKTIKGIIGPNGAGKSTLFHLITGMERPTSGRVYYKGIDITSMKPHEISGLGVSRTFQTLQIWENMTVVENILTGMHTRLKGRWLSSGLWVPSVQREEEKALTEAKKILEFLGLLGRWKWPASQLSFGAQKMLEMGRALAMKPELLLLDEPASGLTLAEVKQLSEKICKLREDGMTVLIVEHHMGMVMEIADEVAVLHHGELISEGSPDLVGKDPRTISVYGRDKVDASN